MILIYLVFADPIKGQQVNFNSIDSLSYQLYLKGAWDSLLQLGKLAEKADIVYPNLSLRLGYAAFMKGNNSLSLKHFNYVLKENSFNQNALYYAVLNNKLLSRNEAAAFRSKNLDEDLKKPLNVGYKKLVESIDVETSFKPTNSEVRKMGKFLGLVLVIELTTVGSYTIVFLLFSKICLHQLIQEQLIYKIEIITQLIFENLM
jgi:hypothetical protein